MLLIEDDDDVRSSTEQALTLAGFEVDAFASAERARAADQPRRAGDRGVRRAPAGHERHRMAAGDPHRSTPNLPVILVTGHGDIAMAVQAMRDGAYDFIEKPFTSERLVAIARHAVERRQLALAGARRCATRSTTGTASRPC